MSAMDGQRIIGYKTAHPLIVRLSSRRSPLSIRCRPSGQTAAFANNHWQGQAVDTAVAARLVGLMYPLNTLG